MPSLPSRSLTGFPQWCRCRYDMDRPPTAVVYSPIRLHTVLLSPSHGRYSVRCYLKLVVVPRRYITHVQHALVRNIFSSRSYPAPPFLPTSSIVIRPPSSRASLPPLSFLFAIPPLSLSPSMLPDVDRDTLGDTAYRFLCLVFSPSTAYLVSIAGSMCPCVLFPLLSLYT